MKFIPRPMKSRLLAGLIAPWVVASLASTTALAAAAGAPPTPPPPLLPVEQPAATLIKQGEPPVPGLDQIRDGMLAEASRDLTGAEKAYAEAVHYFNSQRDAAATASWRLAEVQRLLGQTNEAKLELHRLIQNYPDQTNLVKSAAAALKLLDGVAQGSGQARAGMGVPNGMDPAMSARYGLRPTPAATPAPDQIPSAKTTSAQAQYQMDPALARRYGLTLPNQSAAGVVTRPASARVEDPNSVPTAEERTSPIRSTQQLSKTTDLSREESEAIASRISFINNLDGREKLLALMEAFPDEYLSNLVDQERKLRLRTLTDIPAGLDANAQKELTLRQEDQARRLADEIKRRTDEIVVSKQLLLDMSRKQAVFKSSYAAGQKVSAVETKEIEDLEAIITNSPDLINSVDGGGATRIHKAAINGWIVVADYLLANGANLHQTADNGFSPLHYATTQGHKAMTAFLLEKGARIDARSNSGMTPLYLAAEKGFKSIVNLLLERGATVKSTNDPMPALNVAAAMARPEIVQILLSKGADPNLRHIEWGKTPLTSAVQGQNLQCVQILLAAGARINERDREGNTALSLSLNVQRRDANSIALTKLLLERGADPKIPGRQGALPIIGALEQSSSTDLLAALLEHGADPNLAFNAAEHPGPPQSIEGYTPLHQAVNLGKVEHVELLLKKGANPNIKQNSNGKYPFALTANPRIQKLLIEHGFDLKRLEETIPGPGLRSPGAAGFLTTGDGVRVLPAIPPGQPTPPSAP